MVTGYGSDLYNDNDNKITFPKFAISCASIIMRSPDEPFEYEPFSAQIFKVLPNDYYLKELKNAKKRMSAIKKLDNTKAKQKAGILYEDAFREYERFITENKTLRKRYESMLVKVKAWIPPTPDHKEFKEFMVKQLDRGIEHDCNYTPSKPIRISGEAYKRKVIKDIQWYIKYYTKEYKKEVEKAKSQTEWMRSLYKSLSDTV